MKTKLYELFTNKRWLPVNIKYNVICSTIIDVMMEIGDFTIIVRYSKDPYTTYKHQEINTKYTMSAVIAIEYKDIQLWFEDVYDERSHNTIEAKDLVYFIKTNKRLNSMYIQLAYDTPVMYINNLYGADSTVAKLMQMELPPLKNKRSKTNELRKYSKVLFNEGSKTLF